MKRKALTAAILVLIIVVVLALPIYLKFVRKGGRKAETGEFIGMKYSPGFSDLRGGSYSAALKKNENGEWIIESRSRESHADPILVVTYSVDEEKLAEFVTFLKDENVADLSKRKDSDEFAYDYNPWSISIGFDNSAIGGSKSEWYEFGQYKNYSAADRELSAADVTAAGVAELFRRGQGIDKRSQRAFRCTLR